jgi:hypothetical protein
MGTDRAEEHSLAAEEPGEQTVGSALPAIAAKADDLEEIKKSVEDAASVSGGLWLIHAYALMHFIMLGKKASRFHNELRRPFPDSETNTQTTGASPDGAHKDIRDKLGGCCRATSLCKSSPGRQNSALAFSGRCSNSSP